MRRFAILISCLFLTLACDSASTPEGEGGTDEGSTSSADGSAQLDDQGSTAKEDTGSATTDDTGSKTIADPGNAKDAGKAVLDVALDDPGTAVDEGTAAQCPVDQPEPNATCDSDLSCEWGEECCCGDCHSSFACSCSEGQWACHYTDACLGAGALCPDVQETDAGEAPVDTGSQGGVCPADQATPGGVCTGEASCDWGEECCCGECHTSFHCDCSEGSWACYNTDACFIDSCPDAGGTDTGPEPVVCPADQPGSGDTCTGEGTCGWGEECCCGDCSDSTQCSCQDGQWACLATDFCYGRGGSCPCHDGNDCDGFESCFYPGQEIPCGICREAVHQCAQDADCNPEGGERICLEQNSVRLCLCSGPERQCVDRCTAESCAEGESCGADGRCAPTACESDDICPTHFRCAPMDGECRRKRCDDDAGCGDGFCVQGRCYDRLGTCSAIPG